MTATTRLTLDEAVSILETATTHTINEGPMRIHTVSHPQRGQLTMIEGTDGDFIAIGAPGM